MTDHDLSKFALNEADGTLCYAYCDGIYFLSNPIAALYAAAVGIPACSRDWEYLVFRAGSIDIISDDADMDDPQVREFYDAALKVLAATDPVVLDILDADHIVPH